MNQETTIREAGQNDLAGIVSRYRRHIPVSIAIIVACMVLAGIATRFMPRQYTATTDMTYAPQVSLVKGAAEAGQSDTQRDAAIDAQLQIAASLPVARDVIARAGLAGDPDLVKAAASFRGTNTRDDAMAAALLRDVTVRRVGQTALFRISYTADDPIQAARVANAFATAYLSTQRDQKLAQTSATADQLSQKVAALGRDADAAEAAVTQYRLAHNLIANPDSTTQDQQIATIDTALAEARGQAALARARSAASGSAVVGGGPGGGIDTSAASRLLEQQASASSDLASLTARYGDLHPEVIAARQRLHDVQAQLAAERSQVSRAAGAESTAAGARAASLANSLSNARGQKMANVRASGELASLERKAEIARQLYQNMLSAKGEQTAQRDLTQADSRQVAPATPPLRPSSPNMLVNILVGMALGLAAALTLAFLRERWTQTLNTIDDIDRLLGVGFLNSIPTLQSAIRKPMTKDPAKAVILHPMSAFTESYRNLAATVMFKATGDEHAGCRVIGITSALPREGKTTTSIAVARVMAMGGSKVALVDADLRRRSTTLALAPEVTQGWTDVDNAGGGSNTVALQDETGMILIPIGPDASGTHRAFDSARFDALIHDLRQRFDIVLVDTAPVLAVVDTRTMLRQFDSLVLLARWRQTPVKAIRAAIHQIQSVGGTISGVAMTLVNLKTQAQSGYGDASYYYKEMKDYYISE